MTKSPTRSNTGVDAGSHHVGAVSQLVRHAHIQEDQEPESGQEAKLGYQYQHMLPQTPFLQAGQPS